MLMRALLLAGLALVSGCALTSSRGTLPQVAGPVANVPFFPQREYQCGPAALATLLVNRGVATTPDSLVPRIYVPGRKGSFQAEIIAEIRRQGLVPWQIDGTVEALAAELHADRPVLVLQNLLVPSWPRWHYAIVYGMRDQRVLLRSGRDPEQRTWAARFLRTWGYADHWAVVALRPGEMPARPDAKRWLETYAAFEAIGQPAQAAVGYQTGVRQWPQDSLLWFALGNSQYLAERKELAEASWRRGLRIDPGFAPGWNNLAQRLAERGCGKAARAALTQAQRFADARLGAALAGTQRQVAASPAGGVTCEE
ncbi:MAG: PA2778 family cysteine peptidase [Steroidobacteraceae bacterium]